MNPTFAHESMSFCFKKSVPKQQTATYDGDPQKWLPWLGVFNSIIDQARMSDTKKLIHLQSLLKGEAAQLISGYSCNGTTFKTALIRHKNHPATH